jgi:hypothetical protein
MAGAAMMGHTTALRRRVGVATTPKTRLWVSPETDLVAETSRTSLASHPMKRRPRESIPKGNRPLIGPILHPNLCRRVMVLLAGTRRHRSARAATIPRATSPKSRPLRIRRARTDRETSRRTSPSARTSRSRFARGATIPRATTRRTPPSRIQLARMVESDPRRSMAAGDGQAVGCRGERREVCLLGLWGGGLFLRVCPYQAWMRFAADRGRSFAAVPQLPVFAGACRYHPEHLAVP